jgi:hypothetical protein
MASTFPYRARARRQPTEAELKRQAARRRKAEADFRDQLRERGLASHMNDTKWRELIAAVRTELPFEPPFVAYYVYAPDRPPPYGGIWEREDLHIGTERIRVWPRLWTRRGRLLPAEVIDDCSDQFRAILERLNVPYTESDGEFTLYGHAAGVAFDNQGLR